MGQGGYIFCEWDSIEKEVPTFQNSFRALENEAILRCTNKWFPKKLPQEAFGFLSPKSGEQFGRTSILPALFRDWYDGTVKTFAASRVLDTTSLGGSPVGTWRQLITTPGHMILLHGRGSGHTIPEDFYIAWIGLAFPNKQQQISELKWQIGDRKFGRLNIEEMRSYNKPAIIFEEGLIIEEKQAVEIYGYVEHADYQRMIPLGAAYYRTKDKVLSDCGSPIT
jgi:hypothetical protein